MNLSGDQLQHDTLEIRTHVSKKREEPINSSERVLVPRLTPLKTWKMLKKLKEKQDARLVCVPRTSLARIPKRFSSVGASTPLTLVSFG
jgi:hypothetical protein